MTLDTQVLGVGAAATYEDEGWVADLTVDGPAREFAHRRLHTLLVGASRRQVWRLRDRLPGAGPGDLEDLAQQAADEALVTVLRKLDDFEGRSRFSTWAYKFGVFQAGVEVRRQAWRNREVTLPDRSPLSTELRRRQTWRRRLTSPAPWRTPSPPASVHTNAGSCLPCWSTTCPSTC